MRLRGVVLATSMLLPGCGEDEIVARAKKKNEAQSTAATTAPAAAPATAPSGAAGAPGAGIPEQPKPGIPEEPAPAPPGTPQAGGAAAPQPGVPGQPVPGSAVAPGAGEPGQPTPGVPEQPKPGIPAQPPPGQGGNIQQMDGPVSRVRGGVVFDAWRGGAIRIDAFDGDHSRPGTHPRIVATTRIERPGAFELVIPRAAGKVWIEASIDEDGDGRPGPQDPQGIADRYPVTISGGDVDRISVNLSKREPPPGGKNKDDF